MERTVRDGLFPNIRILFVGNGNVGSNAFSFYKGFLQVADRTQLVDSSYFDSPPRFSMRRLLHKFMPVFYSIVSAKILTRRINHAVNDFSPDVLFVFRGSYIESKLLKNLNCVKIHYHPDDSSNDSNRSYIFGTAEIFYDLHFTSKRHNLPEIMKRTNKPAQFIWYAYDPDWHFRSEELDFAGAGFLVGFIGHQRNDRTNLIFEVSRIYGKKFLIVGSKWDRFPSLKHASCVLSPKYGPDLKKIIAEAPIQLGLLNSLNRDQHTARSFEIPALGALLIAEDTQEHREIFGDDGINVLYFSTNQELFYKLNWVQQNPLKAAIIAKNGYEFITSGNNTWKDRASEVLDYLYTHIF